MNKKSLGYDPKTGRHCRRLTATENKFLALLWEKHTGKNNKISAIELAVRFDCALNGFEPDEASLFSAIKHAPGNPQLDLKKRTVRRMHNHLLTQHDNIPILSKAGCGGGYWLAEDSFEASAFYETFRKRGMTGLVKASRGKKAILVDLVKQISFEFDDLVDKSEELEHIERRPAAGSAPVAVVDAFLEKMLQNPEKFSADLEKIGKKFGSVLLPKGRVEEMQKKAAELQELVSSLQI